MGIEADNGAGTLAGSDEQVELEIGYRQMDDGWYVYVDGHESVKGKELGPFEDRDVAALYAEHVNKIALEIKRKALAI